MDNNTTNDTVYVYMKAGLCNQLFMLFACISYALDNGKKYLIYSRKNCTFQNNKLYWDSLLDKFNDKLFEDNVIGNKIPRYDEEKNFNYMPIPAINQEFMICGYYQTEKYFKHNYEKILDIMDFHTKQAIIKNKYPEYFTKKTIAIHFRLGDYIGLQFNHPIMKPSYYVNALKHYESILGESLYDYNILYFCQRGDNYIVDKYIEEINDMRNYNFVKVSDDMEDWEQLLVMSLCDNFIIANSTFSWFGAYFSQNKNKIITYPSIWFGQGLKHLNTSHICPEEWIKIDAS